MKSFTFLASCGMVEKAIKPGEKKVFLKHCTCKQRNQIRDKKPVALQLLLDYNSYQPYLLLLMGTGVEKHPECQRFPISLLLKCLSFHKFRFLN